MRTRPIPRRTLLRGLLGAGSVAVGLPLLEAMLDSNGEALADGSPLPLRFGVWFWGNGTRYFYRPPPHMPRDEWLRSVQYYNPDRKLPELDLAKWIWHLPTRDLLRAAGAPASDYEDLIAKSLTDPPKQRS